MKTLIKSLFFFCAFYLTVACAQCGPCAQCGFSCAYFPAANIDPYERFNRAMFAFNSGVDTIIIRPVAVVYDKVLPWPIKKGVANFFDNVQMPGTIVNDILQFKMKYMFTDFVRLTMNTIFGIGGLFDVATPLGVPKHYEDFGLTFAYWSHGRPSYYIVWPILGPRTLRDTMGLPFDYFTRPWTYINPFWVSLAAWGGYLISYRASLLDTDAIIRQSFDPYIFVRSAYLQYRQKLINDNSLSGPSEFESGAIVDSDITLDNISDNTPATGSVLSTTGPKDHNK